MSLEETASRCFAPRLQSSEVHGTKENLLEHLRRELNILQIHNKWNQIVLTQRNKEKLCYSISVTKKNHVTLTA